MAKGILGKKIGMTQIFEADGRLIPVTVVEASTALSFAATIESFAVLTAAAFLALEASTAFTENTLVSASAPARANESTFFIEVFMIISPLY